MSIGIFFLYVSHALIRFYLYAHIVCSQNAKIKFLVQRVNKFNDDDNLFYLFYFFFSCSQSIGFSFFSLFFYFRFYFCLYLSWIEKSLCFLAFLISLLLNVIWALQRKSRQFAIMGRRKKKMMYNRLYPKIIKNVVFFDCYRKFERLQMNLMKMFTA